MIDTFPNKSLADATKVKVFNFLSAHTEESNTLWARFRKETNCTVLFPIPDYAFLNLCAVTENEKIVWVNKHRRVLFPLLHWWSATR